MTKILEKQLVRAPLASAHRFLDAFFAAHRSEADGDAYVTLKAGDMARDAIVTLTAAHRPADMTPRFAVAWKDAQDGPYPHFAGELNVESDDDYNAFWLVLEGTYAPPGGLGGQLFDAVIGKHIAEKTAKTLLTEIADETERQFNVEEAAKVRAT